MSKKQLNKLTGKMFYSLCEWMKQLEEPIALSQIELAELATKQLAEKVEGKTIAVCSIAQELEATEVVWTGKLQSGSSMSISAKLKTIQQETKELQSLMLNIGVVIVQLANDQGLKSSALERVLQHCRSNGIDFGTP